MNLLSPAAFAGSAALAAALGTATFATFAPRASLWRDVIWHGDRAGPPRVALTFDDGPTPDHTPAILDALEEFNVLATFFVVGRNAARFPALLRRIHEQGHVIGNHSFDHDHFGVMRGTRYWRDQLARTDEVILAETGRRALFFRPPMGHKSPFLARASHCGGYHLTTWTRRALDGLPTTDTRILRRLDGRMRPGDIVALHDGVEPHGFQRSDATVRALRPLLRSMRQQGLCPVRLDEIIGLAAYATEDGDDALAATPDC